MRKVYISKQVLDELMMWATRDAVDVALGAGIRRWRKALFRDGYYIYREEFEDLLRRSYDAITRNEGFRVGWMWMLIGVQNGYTEAFRNSLFETYRTAYYKLERIANHVEETNEQ